MQLTGVLVGMVVGSSEIVKTFHAQLARIVSNARNNFLISVKRQTARSSPEEVLRKGFKKQR